MDGHHALPSCRPDDLARPFPDGVPVLVDAVARVRLRARTAGSCWTAGSANGTGLVWCVADDLMIYARP